MPGIASRPAKVEGHPYQKRSIEQLRATLSMLCNFVWTGRMRPGEHMWTIPVDLERDFDCILSDAIVEGIVWHHPDGRMVKIKTKDFGLKRAGTT